MKSFKSSDEFIERMDEIYGEGEWDYDDIPAYIKEEKERKLKAWSDRAVELRQEMIKNRKKRRSNSYQDA